MGTLYRVAFIFQPFFALCFCSFSLGLLHTADLLPFAKYNNLSGNIYSPLTWSGYITWQTSKKLQIFVDTRFEPFSRNQILASVSFTQNPDHQFIPVLKSYNTDYFILPYFHKHRLKESEYEILVEDDYAFLAKIK